MAPKLPTLRDLSKEELLELIDRNLFFVNEERLNRTIFKIRWASMNAKTERAWKDYEAVAAKRISVDNRTEFYRLLAEKNRLYERYEKLEKTAKEFYRDHSGVKI